MKITKNRYLMGFAAIVVLLALVRLIFPSVAAPRLSAEEMLNDSTQVELAESKTDKETAESSALNAKVEKDSIKKAEEAKNKTEETEKPLPIKKLREFP